MKSVGIFSFSIKYRTDFPFAPKVPNFTFDCRGIRNPGRERNLTQLTGLDAAVRTFLDDEQEAGVLVKSASELVATYLRKALQSGYDDPIIGFSCTGGRHRSVYFAESVAADLRNRFPQLEVTVSHLDIASNYRAHG